MDTKILWSVLATYITLSMLAFVAYAIDKAAACKGGWRISENTLHLLDFLGGWPGGWIAQKFLRHKSSKQPFQRLYWVTVAWHCCALAWLLSPYGSSTLNAVTS